MKSFTDKTVLITGGGGAIGGALARAFAHEGARIVLLDLNGDAAQRVADELPEGTRSMAERCDIASEADVAAVAERIEVRFGTPDILINNAAVSVFARVWEVPLDLVAWMHNVNVLGTLHLLRAFVPKMIDRGTPAHIVNVASMAGMIGGPTLGAYSASKHAVVGLTDSLRGDLKEIGADIGVTLVAPGPVKTQGLKAMRERTEAITDPVLSAKMTQIMDSTESMVLKDGIEPEAVANQILTAIRNNLFWVTCPPASVGAITYRSNEALADSNRMTELSAL